MSAVIAWLFGPVGRWLLVAGAVLVGLWLVYDRGYDAGVAKVTAQWDAANRAAALAAQRRDEGEAEAVARDSAAALAAAQSELRKITEERDAYLAEVLAADAAAGDCVLDERLRGLLRHPPVRSPSPGG